MPPYAFQSNWLINFIYFLGKHNLRIKEQQRNQSNDFKKVCFIKWKYFFMKYNFKVARFKNEAFCYESVVVFRFV